MSAQNDMIAGFDPSSVSSITQAQLLQMINQLAPLANIGLVVAQAGTSAASTIAQGTGGSPSVTDNARFARYIWLNLYSDPPTPYYYDAGAGDWTATTIAALSITNAEISATAAIAVTKLATGTAYYVVRTNAAGTSVEYVSPANIHDSIKLPISGLTPNASDGFLKTASGVMAWSTNAAEYATFQAAIANLAPAQLQPGTNGYVLTTAAGIPIWAAAGTVFGAGSEIPTAALAQSGAATNNLLQWNGSAWVPVTQSLIVGTSATISTTGLVPSEDAGGGATNGDLTNGTHRVPHGFGSTPPKLIRVVVETIGVDATAGYAIGDEIDINTWFFENGTLDTSLFNIYSGADGYVYIAQRGVSAGNILVQAKGASAAVKVNPTALTNFQIKVYAWQ